MKLQNSKSNWKKHSYEDEGIAYDKNQAGKEGIFKQKSIDQQDKCKAALEAIGVAFLSSFCFLHERLFIKI